MRFRGCRKPEIPYDTVQYQNPYETFGTIMQTDPKVARVRSGTRLAVGPQTIARVTMFERLPLP